MIRCFTNRIRTCTRQVSTYVNTPTFVYPNEINTIPIYRVLDHAGNVENNIQIPQISDEKMVDWFKNMVFLNVIDDILLESQRQGRLTFHVTHYGEEAFVSVADAISPRDLISPQYRELGMLIQRGYSLKEIMDLAASNVNDHAIGRLPNPIYFSRKLNIFSTSMPLGTQIPQAVGQAYAKKMSGDPDSCVLCIFGEGAASEGDVFTGLNFAATLGSPVLFMCRNNQYAISTHSSQQYSGDAIAGRAVGMGIPAIRVDGNDVFALYNATKAARQICIEKGIPVLIEAMTYRLSHHSTSDDSSAYREDSELEEWKTTKSPFRRFRNYLTSKGLWDADTEDQYRTTCFKKVVSQLKESEKTPKPGPETIYEQLYSDVPLSHRDQQRQLDEHIAKHKEYYAN